MNSKLTFKNRLLSMLKMDIRRIFTMPIYYIFLGISLVMPILILVMTTLMVGMESVDRVTGEVTIMEEIFTNTFQIIGSVPGYVSENPMDLASMCNINMIYMLIAVVVSIFISEDFRSGYSKHLFTTRAKKLEYVISKTITAFIYGALLLLVFFVGALIGGGASGLPFTLDGFSIYNIVMCIISKCLLVLVFSPIFITMAVIGKEKAWLSILLSLGVGMLLYMMIPSITPLNSTVINLFLALAGGIIFSIGMGAISNVILKKTSLV